MEIKLVVCDLAGTTIKDNRDVHRTLLNALAEFGISITLSEANTVMGIPKPVAIRKLLELKDISSQELTDALIHEIHNVFVNEMIRFYRNDEGFGEKPGVSETFEKFKQMGIKVVADTGFDRAITDSILDRTGWLKKGLMDHSVSSDEVLRGRPHPDLVYKAMQLTKITDVRQVAKVGDTISDLVEGTSAGCGMVVGVTTGAFTRDQLASERHTHLIDEFAELAEILLVKAPLHSY